MTAQASMFQALEALLECHESGCAREQACLQRMRELTLAGAQALSRQHLDPGHFTASAFILGPTGRQLLLIHHSKLRRWLQPGGHLEPGDSSPLETARREAREETGLTELTALATSAIDLDIHPIPETQSVGAHYHFDVRFAFRAAATGAHAGSDASDTRWVPLALLRAAQAQLPNSPLVGGGGTAVEVAGLLTDRSVLQTAAKLAIEGLVKR
jgi:8-oxo-dGTP pyrophosphatase MutT (NUDIX family)